ncbi:alpha/beta hydrolase [Microbacterium chocolatum]|uniref:alpha/beta fold hydrolase n=1 Tax=Microbacterium aurantiacum TaxID=162393 RepID=UPI00338F900E
MTEPENEFSFLSAQAVDAGATGPLPRAERLFRTLADGRTLSALRYTPATAPTAGPAVTFLHGAGLNAHTWDTTILALGLPALAIDLPGHGDSSWREDAAYVGRVLAPDIVEGIRAWADGPQVLVGHSLGGLTAAAVAASAPELVRDLVVVDITPGIDPNGGAAQLRAFFAGPTDWATRDEVVDRALAFGLGGGARAKVARGVFFNTRVRPDGRVEWKHHFARLAHDSAASAADGSTAAAGPDAVAAVLGAAGWEDLAAVTAPLTLVRAERGFLTDDDEWQFRARLPSARIVRMDAGHNVQEDQPQTLAALVRSI